MTPLSSFRSVVQLWISPEAMATELGTSPYNPRKWLQRDKIPAGWWASILGTKTAREKGVTAELLATLARREVAAEKPEPEGARI